MLRMLTTLLLQLFVIFSALVLTNNVSYAQGLVMSNCKAEIKKFCPHVQHGMGRVPACLEKHMDALSDKCKAALHQRQGRMR